MLADPMQRDQGDELLDPQLVTKETLAIANCFLNLALMHSVTKSALMLLSADSSNGTLAD